MTVKEAIPFGNWVLMTFSDGQKRLRHAHSGDLFPVKFGACPNCGAIPDETTMLKLKLWLKSDPNFKGYL